MKTTIETIINTLEKDLTHEALIGSKHDKKWSRKFCALFLTSIAAPISYIIFITAQMPENSRWFSPLLLSCIAALALSILLIIFIGEEIYYKIFVIIEREYKKYGLNITDSWNQETISEIQLLKFEEFLKIKNIQLSPAHTDLIVEELRIKASTPAYRYNITTSAIQVIGSAIIAAAAEKLLDLGSNSQDMLSILIKIFTIALVVLLFIFSMDATLIKWQASKNKIKYERMIRILINHSLNRLNK